MSEQNPGEHCTSENSKIGYCSNDRKCCRYLEIPCHKACEKNESSPCYQDKKCFCHLKISCCKKSSYCNSQQCCKDDTSSSSKCAITGICYTYDNGKSSTCCKERRCYCYLKISCCKGNENVKQCSKDDSGSCSRDAIICICCVCCENEACEKNEKRARCEDRKCYCYLKISCSKKDENVKQCSKDDSSSCHSDALAYICCTCCENESCEKDKKLTRGEDRKCFCYLKISCCEGDKSDCDAKKCCKNDTISCSNGATICISCENCGCTYCENKACEKDEKPGSHEDRKCYCYLQISCCKRDTNRCCDIKQFSKDDSSFCSICICCENKADNKDENNVTCKDRKCYCYLKISCWKKDNVKQCSQDNNSSCSEDAIKCESCECTRSQNETCEKDNKPLSRQDEKCYCYLKISCCKDQHLCCVGQKCSQ